MTSSSPTSAGTCYRIGPYKGKPTLFIDDQPEPACTYCYANDPKQAGARRIHDRFIESGYRFFMPQVRGGLNDDWDTTPFWTGDGEFPDVTAAGAPRVEHAELIEYILERQPEARFWVRSMLNPPKAWRDARPDELLLNSYGKRYDHASLASDSYNRQIAVYLDRLVDFCERQPWADRVAGYIVYPIGEGTTVLTCDGFLFDRSPAMQDGFRAFLKRRYGRDDVLQAAWKRPDVTLATAEVPDDEDFHRRGQTDHGRVSRPRPKNAPAPHRLHWPEPDEIPAERDYCFYMRELTERNFRTIVDAIKHRAPHKVAGLDAFKQTMLGWPLVARWTGDYKTHAGTMHGLSGAFAMSDLLDIPGLDAVATPHDYLHRGMGFGYEGEGIGDSVVLHGKLMLMEEDQRIHGNVVKTDWNALTGDREIHAGLWRNLGASLSRGYNTYPTDISGPSFYGDAFTQEVLKARRRVHEAAMHWEHEDLPGIAMIVDDASLIDEEPCFTYQYLSVIEQRLNGLSRCGVPYRLYLFEDLFRDDFPAFHRCFLFPNLFRVTPERLAVLREKIFGDGRVAVFGPASGLAGGRRLSADGAVELTGIPLELCRKESPRRVTVDRFDHPLTAGFPRRLDFGDSFPYGPLLMPCKHPEVVRLGGIQWPSACDGDGLVIREFGRGARGRRPGGPRGPGDYAAVFTCAVPMPAPLLRELARYAGAHVYGEEDDLIFADRHTVTVHSVHPGRRTVRLPSASDVWDLVRRERIGQAITEIVTEGMPPRTELFYLGSNDPFA